MAPAIRKTILTICLGIVPFLASGATGNTPNGLVARAKDLNPTPSVRSESFLVEEQVVYASEPIRAVAGGSGGYVMSGNNCVVCVRNMTGRSQNGNAGTWSASSSTPWIGAIMIFRAGEQGASSAGHVGVVIGIRGSIIELAHCNWLGQTEFQSTGKFF